MTSFWQSVRLVAEREITVRLRDKTFLATTLFFLIFAAASAILPSMLSSDPSTVAVSDRASVSVLTDAGLTVRETSSADAAEELLRSGDVDAAVVSSGQGVTVLAMDDAPDDVVSALSQAPSVRLLDPDAVSPILRYLIPMAFGMVFFSTSLTFGIQIAQSVTEEKQTRIVEILVATVPVRAMLAGKVIGNSILAMAQILLISVVALTGMQLADTGTLLNQLGPAIGWFIPFFVVGFVLLASLWAVAGALVSRQEDISAASMPVQALVMVPFFGVIFFNGNPTVMTVLSYVPFSAPTAMPLRLFFSDAASWEPVLSLVLLLAAAAACIMVAARIYEGSLLRTNGRTSLAAAWRRIS